MDSLKYIRKHFRVKTQDGSILFWLVAIFRTAHYLRRTSYCKLPAAYSLLLTAYCLLPTKIQAQDTLAIQEPQIVVMARPTQEGTIMLRWAVTTSRAWRKLNKYGYQLTRYQITENNSLVQPEEWNLGTFKPKPLEDWMPHIETNNNAAVMAQSLYGETFDIEGQDELSAIVNLAEEQEQRFTWGLYAADQDYKTAQMAGMGYIDTDVQPNEKYVYKVKALVPRNELDIQEGGVFIGLKDYESLPKPLDLAGVFLDGKTMLSWNYAIHKELYNSYFVERSEDGISFKRINDLPLTGLNNSDRTDAKRMFYIDSITNNKPYHYRILGRTPFGELSPPSDVVSGEGEQVLAYVPRITTRTFLDDKRAIIEWEFLEEGNAFIKGFELNRSDTANGKYEVVMQGLSPTARKVQYDHLKPTNYLTITAVGKNGSERTSFPALVQPVDSVPPIKPIGLAGIIDSLGVVTLNWEANKEKDILGYRVFRGNNKKEEFSQITISPHQATTFYDSISVKNLNAKVYYQLIAVDQRYNMSEPSEILEIKKPDFIKPTKPIFSSYTIKDTKVHMTWVNSSSEDVVKHEIYRKERDGTDWQLVHTQSADSDGQWEVGSPPTPNHQSPTNWTDKDIQEGKQYSYTIIAIDDSNLESDPAAPLTVIIPKATIPPAIKELSSYINREKGHIELFWKPYKEAQVAELLLYKGHNDDSISLFQSLAPNEKHIVDEKVKPNNEYVYMLRAVFKDGRMSKMTSLHVNF